MDAGRLLKAWVMATAVVAVAGLTWAFAPILIPLALVAAGCAGVSILVIAAARTIERTRGRPEDPDAH